MVAKSFDIQNAGYDNRASNTALPTPTRDIPFGKFRNAVNVDFDLGGNIVFPRMGMGSFVYIGTTDSWFEYEHPLGYGFFTEDNTLKRLNLDRTATALKDVGSMALSYCIVDEKVYFSNGIVSGIYKDGEIYEWGVEVPPRQPDATAISTGGMYAGEYRVAITWLSGANEHYEESGTGESVRVTVAEGGGVLLNNFPTPPASVDLLAVYISSVNGGDMYLYDEYATTVSEVYLTRQNGTVALETQFAIKPQPKFGLTLHYGRIYWRNGKFVFHTDDQRYGLQREGQYLAFENEVRAIVSVPGALYVGTTAAIYRFDGVGTDQMTMTKVKSYGLTEDAVAYDIKESKAYAYSDVGLLEFSTEGIRELHFQNVATPKFERGTLSVIYTDEGYRRLVFVGREGTVSRLQHSDYNTGEVARGNASKL